MRSTITPPADYAGSFNLTVTATATEAATVAGGGELQDADNTASTSQSFTVTVDPVRDSTLSVSDTAVKEDLGQAADQIASVPSPTAGPQPLTINLSLGANEVATSITITGVPAGVAFNHGSAGPGGTWVADPGGAVRSADQRRPERQRRRLHARRDRRAGAERPGAAELERQHHGHGRRRGRHPDPQPDRHGVRQRGHRDRAAGHRRGAAGQRRLRDPHALDLGRARGRHALRRHGPGRRRVGPHRPHPGAARCADHHAAGRLLRLVQPDGERDLDRGRDGRRRRRAAGRRQHRDHQPELHRHRRPGARLDPVGERHRDQGGPRPGGRPDRLGAVADCRRAAAHDQPQRRRQRDR